jgi:hypothetical protein
MALELLARSAIASISPTLLSEPERDQRNVLYALQSKTDKNPPRSIGTSQVVSLCGDLVSGFTADDVKLAMAIVNRRNEELHSGESAFLAYRVDLWIAGFYRCCKILNDSMGYELADLFGEDEASIAATVMSETETEVLSKVKSTVAAHRKVFESKTAEDKKKLFEKTTEESERLGFQRHHKVKCPACDGPATVQGSAFGPEHSKEEDGEIVFRQSVLPDLFTCNNCGLRLNGFSSICAAGLGQQYTRTTTMSIAEYYGMIDPADSMTIELLLQQHIEDIKHEYDND